MIIDRLSSNEQVLKELGERVRAIRIDMPLTQAELAQRAGVSLRTVANLEAGRDVKLDSLLSVLRALGLLANVELLVPEPLVRPLALLDTPARRRRATSPKKRSTPHEGWKWGDEQ